MNNEITKEEISQRFDEYADKVDNQLYYETKTQADSLKLGESKIQARRDYATSGLENDGVSPVDYDYTNMVNDGHALSRNDTGVRLPNQYIKPQKIEVAGRDLSTGKRYHMPLNDKEGYAQKGVELLRESYTDSVGGRPNEDSYALSHIAVQSLEEGKSYNDFVQLIPSDWSEEQKQDAWAVANRARDRLRYEEDVKNNPPPTEQPDNNFSVLKVSELETSKSWIADNRILIEKLGNPDNYQDDKSVSQFGLDLMSTFNWNVTAMAAMATSVIYSDDPELQQAFFNVMQQYDQIDVDMTSREGLEFFGRAVGNMATDPFTYASGGIGALAFRGTMATLGKRMGNKYLAPVLARLIAAGNVGATEEGLRAAVVSPTRQAVSVAAGEQESVDPKQVGSDVAESAGVGFVGGVAIGGAFEGGGKLYNRAKEIAGDANFFNVGHLKQTGAVGDLSRGMGMGEDVPQFYSRLSETISTDPNFKKPRFGAEYKKLLDAYAKKGEKFTNEEYKWVGLDDYLTENAGEKITPEQLQEEIDKNKMVLWMERYGGEEGETIAPEFTETVMDDYDDYYHEIEYIQSELSEDDFLENDAFFGYYKQDGEDYDEFVERVAKDMYMQDPNYFYESDNYDGLKFMGSDSRGYYATHDGQHIDAADGYYSYDDVKNALYDYLDENEYLQRTSEGSEGFDGTPKHKQYMSVTDNYRENLYIAGGGKYGSPFTVPHHWNDTENVLVHTRMADATTNDGNKTLYIDEIQSDWHVAGERQGYKQSLTELSQPELDSRLRIYEIAQQAAERRVQETTTLYEKESRDLLGVENPDTSKLDKLKKKLDEEIENLKIAKNKYDESYGAWTTVADRGDYSAESKANAKKVDDIPLKRGRAIKLAMRNEMREAAMKDYDSISFATSQVHKDRWPSTKPEGFENQYDKDMLKYARQLAKKFNSRVYKTSIEDDDGLAVEVYEIEITPQMRASAKKRGVELFQFGAAGTLGLGAMSQGGQDGERNL